MSPLVNNRFWRGRRGSQGPGKMPPAPGWRVCRSPGRHPGRPESPPPDPWRGHSAEGESGLPLYPKVPGAPTTGGSLEHAPAIPLLLGAPGHGHREALRATRSVAPSLVSSRAIDAVAGTVKPAPAATSAYGRSTRGPGVGDAPCEAALRAAGRCAVAKCFGPE